MTIKKQLEALRKSMVELETRMDAVDGSALNAGEALNQMNRKRGHLMRQIWRLEEENNIDRRAVTVETKN